jgi:hypothetical protein
MRIIHCAGMIHWSLPIDHPLFNEKIFFYINQVYQREYFCQSRNVIAEILCCHLFKMNRVSLIPHLDFHPKSGTHRRKLRFSLTGWYLAVPSTNHSVWFCKVASELGSHHYAKGGVRRVWVFIWYCTSQSWFIGNFIEVVCFVTYLLLWMMYGWVGNLLS